MSNPGYNYYKEIFEPAIEGNQFVLDNLMADVNFNDPTNHNLPWLEKTCDNLRKYITEYDEITPICHLDNNFLLTHNLKRNIMVDYYKFINNIKYAVTIYIEAERDPVAMLALMGINPLFYNISHFLSVKVQERLREFVTVNKICDGQLSPFCSIIDALDFVPVLWDAKQNPSSFNESDHIERLNSTGVVRALSINMRDFSYEASQEQYSEEYREKIRNIVYFLAHFGQTKRI